jgi:hypothetical protein
VSFGDEHVPDVSLPSVSPTDGIVTIAPVDDGVELRFTRANAVLMRLWVPRAVALRMEGHLGSEPAILFAQGFGAPSVEYVALWESGVAVFRSVMRGGPGGSVVLPEEVAGRLRLIH